MRDALLLAVEIGGTKLQLVTANQRGEHLDVTRLAVSAADGADGIRQQLAAAVLDLKERFAWSAAGIGYGGPVDTSAGTVSRSFQIGGWSGFPLADWLRELVNCPVVIENDTNAAAIGEALFGAGQGFNPVFYTNSGSGVGGGLVVDRKIYHGAVPGEAEFGHLRLDRAGTIVEDVCSGWAVDRRIRNLAERQPESMIARLLPSEVGGEARFLAPAIAQGDQLAKEILDEVASSLAFALSHVVHLFHPAMIVLGGGLAMLGEPWRAAVAALLPIHLMDGMAPGPQVRLSSLGELVVPVGVLHLTAELLR